MQFELRLQNGNKLYPIGLGWHDIIGEVGTAIVRQAPDFCRDPDFANCFAPHGKAGWYFWRMGEAARIELLDPRSLCAPVRVSDATHGAGFISIEHLSNRRREVRVDVCLSVTPASHDAVSVFDDWSRIVRETRHDLNTEILLRLDVSAAAMRDFDLDRFKSGSRLGTTNIELTIRPSAIQFSRDD